MAHQSQAQIIWFMRAKITCVTAIAAVDINMRNRDGLWIQTSRESEGTQKAPMMGRGSNQERHPQNTFST